MSDWLWLAAMVFMLYFGFVIGVQYAWNRDRIHPFIWGLTHGTRRLPNSLEAVREGREIPPWQRRQNLT